MAIRIVLLSAAIFLLGWNFVDAGKVYKWTDADGRIHFTDQPVNSENAEEIKIRSFSSPAEVMSDEENSFGPREVKMFTTKWCGVCQTAKSYLAARGITYSEYDVEQSEIGRQEFRRLQGKGVPIILVGKQRMDGFSAAKMERMLKNVGYP